MTRQPRESSKTRRSARRRMLAHLQAHGEASVEDLAAVTGLAAVTVRYHLGLLRDRGLVEVRTERSGRGRPPNVYRLAPAGAASLDEGRAMAALADDLLEVLKASAPAAGETFFRDLAHRAAAQQAERVRRAGPAERIEAAVTLLSGRGFAMRWEGHGEEFLVREEGCPFASLSRRHREVCCFDAHVLAEVVDAEVSREAWRVEGAPSCAFRVRPRVGTTSADAPRR